MWEVTLTSLSNLLTKSEICYYFREYVVRRCDGNTDYDERFHTYNNACYDKWPLLASCRILYD